MIFQRRYNANEGIMLADALVALSLGALFVVVTTQIYQTAHDVFYSAQDRSKLLDIYESSSTNPYMVMMTRPYGNDRVEITKEISLNKNSVRFTEIKLRLDDTSNDSIGTPFCSVNLSSDAVIGSYEYDHWTSTRNPQALHASTTAILLPTTPSILLTDLIVRNGIAYISADSSKQSDPDLLIFDIHDEGAAILMSGLHTGPGIAAITLAGNKVYAAVTSRVAQLQVIKLVNLYSPIIESNYKLPLPDASSTSPLSSSIFFNNNRVFLGTEKWDGEELSVIDVATSSAVHKIGGFETSSKINDIYVQAGRAYIVDSDQNQFRILDIQEASHPILLSSFSPSGWERQEGKSISIFENQLNFGRTSGGFNIKQDHELFDMGTSTELLNMELVTKQSLDIGGGVYGVVRDRSYIYVITKQDGAELQVFDHFLSTSTSKTISLPDTPKKMTCDNNALYILATNSPVLYKIMFHF